MRSSLAITLLVLAIGLALGSLGQALLSSGMRRASLAGEAGVLELASRTVREPRVLAGTALQACFFASFLFALSRAELSVILPLTAFDYVLTAVVAGLVLGERLPGLRWAGTFLIVLGIVLVVATSRLQPPERQPDLRSARRSPSPAR